MYKVFLVFFRSFIRQVWVRMFWVHNIWRLYSFSTCFYNIYRLINVYLLLLDTRIGQYQNWSKAQYIYHSSLKVNTQLVINHNNKIKHRHHKIIYKSRATVGDLLPNYHLASSATRDEISWNCWLMTTSFLTGSGDDAFNQGKAKYRICIRQLFV